MSILGRSVEQIHEAARSSEDSSMVKSMEALGKIKEWVGGELAGDVEATDDSGFVTATVARGGELRSVYISARVFDLMSAESVSAACVEAISRARVKAAEELRQIFADEGDANSSSEGQ